MRAAPFLVYVYILLKNATMKFTLFSRFCLSFNKVTCARDGSGDAELSPSIVGTVEDDYEPQTAMYGRFFKPKQVLIRRSRAPSPESENQKTIPIEDN